MGEYSLKFTQLTRYAPNMVADNRSKMSKFMFGVYDSIVKKCRISMLISKMDLSRLMFLAQYIEEKNIKKRERKQESQNRQLYFSMAKLEGGNRSQFQQRSLALAPFSSSVPVPKFKSNNRDGAPGSKYQVSVSSSHTNPLCHKYGRHHQSECRWTVMYILGMANQAIRFGSIGWLIKKVGMYSIRASTIRSPKSAWVQLLVLSVVSSQTGYMFFGPTMINQILLTQLLVHCRSFNYMFMLYQTWSFSFFYNFTYSHQFQSQYQSSCRALFSVYSSRYFHYSQTGVQRLTIHNISQSYLN